MAPLAIDLVTTFRFKCHKNSWQQNTIFKLRIQNSIQISSLGNFECKNLASFVRITHAQWSKCVLIHSVPRSKFRARASFLRRCWHFKRCNFWSVQPFELPQSPKLICNCTKKGLTKVFLEFRISLSKFKLIESFRNDFDAPELWRRASPKPVFVGFWSGYQILEPLKMKIWNSILCSYSVIELPDSKKGLPMNL